jgi:hypothetical protein
MKKKIFVMAMLLSSVYAQSALGQVINGKKLVDVKSTYVQFYAFERTFSSKTFINFEYGQKVNIYDDSAIVKDENGKDLEYNSATAFLNLMEGYGYELFQVINQSKIETAGRTIYILKRVAS